MKKAKFKMTEIGLIPEDWEVKRLGDIGQVVTGSTPPRNDSSNWGGDFNWISAKDFNGKYISKTEEHITEVGKRFCRLLPENSVLVTCIASIGLNAISKKACATNQQINAVVCRVDSSEYLYYQICYRNGDLKLLAGQTAVPIIGKKQFEDVLISLPPLPEQKVIAEVLSDVDALIAAQEELIEKKRAIKQGAMQELLTGKKRLPGFGGEWRTLYLGSIADIRTGKRNGDEQKTDGIYPFFVRSQNIYSIDTYSYDGEAIVVPGEGGIGSIFHYINGKFDFHQRVYKVSDFPNNISCKYVYYYMKHFFGTYALQNTVKATVDSLRLPTFQNFTIDLPPSIAEQKAIAEVLSDMDAEISELEAQKAKFESIKQGMMQELLTGKTRLKGV